ncbi:MAG TPA: hypothetical protein PL048_09550, partial [Leptospiraceae bacterium]|nr:hypothetical protein [Leptospiraceae bacterium]
ERALFGSRFVKKKLTTKDTKNTKKKKRLGPIPSCQEFIPSLFEAWLKTLNLMTLGERAVNPEAFEQAYRTVRRAFLRERVSFCRAELSQFRYTGILRCPKQARLRMIKGAAAITSCPVFEKFLDEKYPRSYFK